MSETHLFDAEDLEGRYAADAVRIGPIFTPPAADLDAEQRTTHDRAQATEREGLLSLLKAALPSPDVLERHEPFFWRMIVSTGQVDSHGTQMMPSSLMNYAADATEGRAFLIGHNRQAAPVGYSLTGRYVAGQGGGVGKRTEVDFYSLRGMADTDPVIAKIEGAMIRDGSISFGGRDMRWICSICGSDILRSTWEQCGHFPGVYYKKDGSRAKGAPKDDLVLCVGFVEDAHMSETSGVYDGSTPGAGVLKAIRAVEAGLLTPNQRAHLEQHYRIHLPGQTFGLAGVPTPEAPMPTSAEEEAARAVATGTDSPPAAAAVTPAVEIPPSASPKLADQVRALGVEPGSDPLAAVRTELDRLRPLADAGQAYRARLVERGLAAGVRAMGNGFQSETWRGSLTAAKTVEDLERMVADLEGMAAKSLPTGRQTEGGVTEPTPIVRQARKIPMRASRQA